MDAKERNKGPGWREMGTSRTADINNFGVSYAISVTMLDSYFM